MRSRNAFLTLIASLLLSFITAVSGLILPLLLISTYGSAINGLIISIRQFLSYLSLVEAGIGYSAMTMLYKPIREQDNKGINSILAAAKIQYYKSGFLFLVLVLGLAGVYPFFVNSDVPWSISFFMVLVLGISGVSEFFLIGKYRVFITAAQKGYIVYVIQSVGVVANILIIFMLVSIKMNPVIVQFLAAIVFVLRYLLLKNYIEKNYKYVDYNAPPSNYALNKRWAVLIHQIVNLVLVSTPIIVITFSLGLKEVSVFSVYLLVHNMIIMILSVFMTGFQSVFGDIISENDTKTLQKNYHLYECLFFSAVAILYSVVPILYLPFIQLYTNGIEDANYTRPEIMVFFVIIGILHNLRVPAMSIINSAGLFKETKLSAIIEAIISLMVSLILVKNLGVEGVLIGWLVAYLYRIIVLIYQIPKKFIYGSVIPTIKVISWNVAFGIVAGLISSWIIPMSINSYIEFVFYGTICTIVSMTIVILFNMMVFKSEFVNIKNKISKVIFKRV